MSNFLQLYPDNNSSSFPKQKELYTDQDIWIRSTVYYIRMCFMPVVVMGTFTKLMNIFVLFEQDMRAYSTSVFLLALTIAELGVMYSELFRLWFEWMYFVPPTSYLTDWYCRISTYMAAVIRNYSNWLVACVTLERFLMVVAPHYARNKCTVCNAKILCIMLFCILCVPSIQYLLYSRAETGGISASCDEHSRWIALDMIDLLISYGAVITVNIFSTALIIALLYRNRITRLSFTKHNRKKFCKSKFYAMQARLARTLSIISVLFLVCETPRTIIPFVIKFTGKTAVTVILLNSSYLLSGINHASNFWMYIYSSQRYSKVFKSKPRDQKRRFNRRYNTKSMGMSKVKQSINSRNSGQSYLRDTLIKNFVKSNLLTAHETLNGCLKIRFKPVIVGDKKLKSSKMMN